MTKNHPNIDIRGAKISANGGAGGAGGSVTIGYISNEQFVMGNNNSQSQSIKQNELKEIIDDLLSFQKGIDDLELSSDDRNIVKGDISTAIKEAKKTNPSLSTIKEKFSSAINTINEAGITIEKINNLFGLTTRIYSLLG